MIIRMIRNEQKNREWSLNPADPPSAFIIMNTFLKKIWPFPDQLVQKAAYALEYNILRALSIMYTTRTTRTVVRNAGCARSRYTLNSFLINQWINELIN